MRLIAEGVSFIQVHEACRLKAYRCPAGLWTIGYGHTGSDVHDGLVIDEDQAAALLMQDLEKFDVFVAQRCPAATPHQHAAMVSLCFNVGCDAFRKSSVARLHNAGRFAEAAQAFSLWNKVKGKVLAGLVSRRAAEAGLYLRHEVAVTANDTLTPRGAEGEKSMTASRTLVGGVVSGASVTLTGTADVLQQMDGWREKVENLLPYFAGLKWALLVLVLMGLCVTIYARWHDRREGRC